MKKTKSTFKINKKSEKNAQTFKQSWEVHFFQRKKRLRHAARPDQACKHISMHFFRFSCIFMYFHAFIPFHFSSSVGKTRKSIKK
jgi:hypothetical protein